MQNIIIKVDSEDNSNNISIVLGDKDIIFIRKNKYWKYSKDTQICETNFSNLKDIHDIFSDLNSLALKLNSDINDEQLVQKIVFLHKKEKYAYGYVLIDGSLGHKIFKYTGNTRFNLGECKDINLNNYDGYYFDNFQVIIDEYLRIKS